VESRAVSCVVGAHKLRLHFMAAQGMRRPTTQVEDYVVNKR
jgi:hypothetical protein